MDSLTGKLILITGATDGLGKQVALELARRGGTLLLHGRNPQKGYEVLKAIRQINSEAPHKYYNADFSSLEQVHHLAASISSEHDHLHILINNAGIGTGKRGSPRQTGADGYELRFTVNYLAPYLLTRSLLPLLRQSTPAAIVNVASGAQAAIDFDNVMLQKNYTGEQAYAQSKLALVLFTFALAEELKGTGITVNALHPASLMDTNMVRQSGLPVKSTVAEGVNTVMHVLNLQLTENISGAYFERQVQAMAHSQAYDKAAQKKLEQLSKKLTALQTPIKHL